MMKKLTLLAMAVGALLAFAIPAAASANVTLTNENEEAVSVGTKVTATSTNTTTTTANGQLSCPKVIIQGEVTTNGSDVGIKSLSTTTEGQCRFAGMFDATITNPAVGDITLTTGGVGTIASATFVSDIPAVGLTCHFSSGSLGISWNSTGVAVSKGALAGTGTGCPTKGEITGSFTLAAGAEALSID
jgi:hypothetical protein